MSLKSRAVGKVYLVHEHPFAYATLTDFEPGKGLIQIYSDWGVYASFWGAMGERTIAEFVTSVDASYMERNLLHWLRYSGVKKEGERRLTKFMAQCWPKLVEEIRKDLKGVEDAG